MRLANKVALITGGNSGIGLATARLFVQEGAKVVITGRNAETLAAARDELGPESVLAVQADAADLDSLERAAAAAVERFGRLDIVSANAGIGGTTPLGSTTLEAFEAILRTNLTGVFFTIQAAAPHLGAGGSVILTGSVHGTMGAPAYSAYAASKGGITAMTKVLASELAPRGIRVNQVTPGATRTPIWSRFASAPGGIEALERRIALAVPSGRLSEAEEVAKAVLFLASDDASNVTAAEIVVDGGHIGAPAGAPIYRS